MSIGRSTRAAVVVVLAVAALAGVVIGRSSGGGTGSGLVLDPNATTVPMPVPTFETAAPSSTVALERVRIDIIGDSFVGGSDMNSSSATTWAAVVEAELHSRYTGTRRISVDWFGMGGSGYVATGQRELTFAEGVDRAVGADADIVVVFGGINDYALQPDPDRYLVAVTEFFDALEERAPDAQVITVGMVWPNGRLPDGIEPLADAIEVGARSADTTFVDGLSAGWFSGSREALIGSDGTHPTDEGHAFIAAELLPVIEEAIARVPG